MEKKPFDIIVTLNPDTIKKDLLQRLAEYGMTMIRINGSFLEQHVIENISKIIRDTCPDTVNLLLDLPGFKPRFTHLPESISFEPDTPITIMLESINYPEIIDQLNVGDFIRVNDGMVRLKIASLNETEAVLIPNRFGVLRRGRGFFLEKKGYRPSSLSLSDLDTDLIHCAIKNNVDYIGLSFVHNQEDIDSVESMVAGSRTRVIPKIESRESMDTPNLISILENSGKAIVDRGDMAGEIGLNRVWGQQRTILDMAKLLDCRVIMATQFFTNMIHKPLPSIAEMDSFIDLLHLGIHGIQLSEETCLGEHGPEVVKLITETVDHMLPSNHQGGSGNIVVWIMGPTSSGKTTIARALTRRLKSTRQPATHIDGDEIRDLYGTDLPFNPENRLRVVKSIVHFAEKAAAAGDNVVVSALTANQDARDFIQNSIRNLCVVYLDCPIDVCADRDPKGLYAKAFKGEIKTLIGVNTPYIPPANKDITVDTASLSADQAADAILRFLLKERNILATQPFDEGG